MKIKFKMGTPIVKDTPNIDFNNIGRIWISNGTGSKTHTIPVISAQNFLNNPTGVQWASTSITLEDSSTFVTWTNNEV